MPPTSARHSARTVVLKAPLSGVLVSIDEVPDPAFAQRLVGDGVSIDPISHTLCAPCAGRIVQVHAAGHAVTLETPEGLEVLMHIGLDTVRLNGCGFTPRVAAGDAVDAGQPLVDFDADFVRQHARSLMTQLVLTNGARVESVEARSGTVVAGVDVALEVTLRDAAAPEAEPGDLAASTLVVLNPLGLHVRPAAALAAEARASVSEVVVWRGPEVADARSVVALLGLDIGRGEAVRVEARGFDAPEAVARVVAALVRAGGASGGPAPDPDEARAGADGGDPPGMNPPPAPATRFAGVAASPGLAVGQIVHLPADEWVLIEGGRGPHHERSRLEHALERAKAELDLLVARVRLEADADKAAIFIAHRELLDDPGLLEPATAGIDAGRSAAAAWRDAVDAQAERVARLQHVWLADRASDLRDVGRRVLRHLVDTAPRGRAFPPGAILVAEDLTPSDVASLDRSAVAGFCTVAGSAASHVAILARSFGMPAVTGIEVLALDAAAGTPAILDGTRGLLVINPTTDEMARVGAQRAREASRRARDLAESTAPAVTTDGCRLEVVANVADLADAARAVSHGAEGVGLVRSEFLFGHRATAPTEDEQYAAYAAIVSALGGGRRVVVRTFDAGGDKPVAYVPIPVEPNPTLGERGTRALLDRPDLLRTQIRAILRASAVGPVGVMFPMIATLDEWRVARRWVEEERAAAGAAPIPVGIVVEVAAAALLADHFAREVDFLSIGTNDLAQYTLAMDRGHPRLASQVDGLHPAVLRLVARTIEAAHAHGKPVSVCGGLASDPQAVPILIGLGADQLSVPVPVIAPVKAQVRRLSRGECDVLARRALQADTAAEVRALVPAADA